MGKCLRILYRITSVIIVAVMLMSVFVCSNAVNAASTGTIQKKEKSYEIAVVFDNSGSMFMNGNKAWSQAKYAMEIFASMLDYENGDKLSIFTMWAVITEDKDIVKGEYWDNFDYNKNISADNFRVDIRNNDDIEKISNMYTVYDPVSKASNTPFAPIQEAYDYLQKSTATDKWLVILSDGEFNAVNRGESTDAATFGLQNRLDPMIGNGIGIQYLGFGEAAELKSKESKDYYTKKSSAKELKDDLVDICNRIFQRSEIPKKYIKGERLELDISMKNLIVFVQGENAKIKSLKNKDGDKVKITLDSGQRKFSTVDANGYHGSTPDTTLYGQVVTFGACEAGKYTLDISEVDKDNIQIFYEPDVDIKLTVTDEKGKEIDLNTDEIQEIEAGEYKVEYTIVDSVTGKDVIDSDLMGDDVELGAEVVNSEGKSTAVKNGERIELKADQETKILVSGTYLKEYTINNEDSSAGFGFKVVPELPDFEVDVKVQQSGSWYKISDHENWEPIRVGLSFDGKPLTDEQLKAVDFDFGLEGISYRYEIVPGESACDVYIAQDESGKYVKPDTGKYKLTVKASYTDEFDRTFDGDGKAKFEVRLYDKFLMYLFWIALLVGLIVLITAILNHKTFPSMMYLYLPAAKTASAIMRDGTSIKLSSKLHSGDLRCDGKPVTAFKNRKKTSAKFKLKDMHASGSLVWFDLDNEKYTKNKSGRFVNADGKTVAEAQPTLGDYAEIKWRKNEQVIKGILYINHKD